MKKISWLAIAVIAQGAVSVGYADGWDPNTGATNVVSDGIWGTRHNLSMAYLDRAGRPGSGTNLGSSVMQHAMNNYGEVCVYCHTPHGANTSSGAGMPLWNRTVDLTLTYELYDTPTTLGLGGEQNVTQPGPASLTCLSCHDGATAIDSVINMPGSGGYNPSLRAASNIALLNTWQQTNAAAHLGLQSCASQCHNGTGPAVFANFVIGAGTDADGQIVAQSGSVVDLRDDHPVGVLYPTALTSQAWVDFREMDVEIPGRYAFFDNGNGRADKNEIRVYDSGDGFEVECASCHDPHGVPEANNVNFIPSFLRVSNGDSTLCLACHIK